MNNWPKENTQEFNDYFGHPCDESNLIRVKAPYTMYYGTLKVKNLYCHKLVADSLVRVLTKVLNYYGIEKIKELNLDKYGGCFSPRKKRGSDKWSTHAWGISLDFDPEHNKLQWGRDKSTLDNPEYDFWWKCWEEEGWVSLGQEKNYDWMHIQAAKLK